MKKTLFTIILSAASVCLFAGENRFSGMYSPVFNDYSHLELKKSAFLMPPGAGGEAWGEGKFVLTAGYGVPNFGKTILKAFDDEAAYTAKGFGPLHFRAEYGLSETVGFGLSVNYVNFGAEWKDDSLIYVYELTQQNTSFLARINFHFGTTEKLDPYFGLGAGYKVGKTTFKSTDPNAVEDDYVGSLVPFGFEMTGGFRYYFSPNIGFYAEIGLAKSFAQGGLAVAF